MLPAPPSNLPLRLQDNLDPRRIGYFSRYQLQHPYIDRLATTTDVLEIKFGLGPTSTEYFQGKLDHGFPVGHCSYNFSDGRRFEGNLQAGVPDDPKATMYFPDTTNPLLCLPASSTLSSSSPYCIASKQSSFYVGSWLDGSMEGSGAYFNHTLNPFRSCNSTQTVVMANDAVIQRSTPERHCTFTDLSHNLFIGFLVIIACSIPCKWLLNCLRNWKTSHAFKEKAREAGLQVSASSGSIFTSKSVIITATGHHRFQSKLLQSKTILTVPYEILFELDLGTSTEVSLSQLKQSIRSDSPKTRRKYDVLIDLEKPYPQPLPPDIQCQIDDRDLEPHQDIESNLKRLLINGRNHIYRELDHPNQDDISNINRLLSNLHRQYDDKIRAKEAFFSYIVSLDDEDQITFGGGGWYDENHDAFCTSIAQLSTLCDAISNSGGTFKISNEDLKLVEDVKDSYALFNELLSKYKRATELLDGTIKGLTRTSIRDQRTKNEKFLLEGAKKHLDLERAQLRIQQQDITDNDRQKDLLEQLRRGYDDDDLKTVMGPAPDDDQSVSEDGADDVNLIAVRNAERQLEVTHRVNEIYRENHTNFLCLDNSEKETEAANIKLLLSSVGDKPQRKFMLHNHRGEIYQHYHDREQETHARSLKADLAYILIQIEKMGFGKIEFNQDQIDRMIILVRRSRDNFNPDTHGSFEAINLFFDSETLKQLEVCRRPDTQQRFTDIVKKQAIKLAFLSKHFDQVIPELEHLGSR